MKEPSWVTWPADLSSCGFLRCPDCGHAVVNDHDGMLTARTHTCDAKPET